MHRGLFLSRSMPFRKQALEKIERAQLKTRWQEGEFDEIIKELDIRLENEHTLPDWSYQKKWTPAPLHEAEKQTAGDMVIFADAFRAGRSIGNPLTNNEQTDITVEPGQAFTQLTHTHFIIHPNRPSDYEQLLRRPFVWRFGETNHSPLELHKQGRHTSSGIG
ncbi:hypothetical protein ACEQPO_02415 [Bacillus sp. SL00103]